jgi:hypothetical protein
MTPTTTEIKLPRSAGTPSADELEASAHEKIAEGHALLARARRMRTLPASDVWLSLDAAGEIAGVRGRVLRDAGRRGEVVIDHVGRSPRVNRAELERWIRSRRHAEVTPSDVALSPREAARAAVAARAAAGSR